MPDEKMSEQKSNRLKITALVLLFVQFAVILVKVVHYWKAHYKPADPNVDKMIIKQAMAPTRDSGIILLATLAIAMVFFLYRRYMTTIAVCVAVILWVELHARFLT